MFFARSDLSAAGNNERGRIDSTPSLAQITREAESRRSDFRSLSLKVY